MTAPEQLALLDMPVAPKPKRTESMACPKDTPDWLHAEIERTVALLEELHPDHWPRWLAALVRCVQDNDAWTNHPDGHRSSSWRALGTVAATDAAPNLVKACAPLRTAILNHDPHQ